MRNMEDMVGKFVYSFGSSLDVDYKEMFWGYL